MTQFLAASNLKTHSTTAFRLLISHRGLILWQRDVSGIHLKRNYRRLIIKEACAIIAREGMGKLMVSHREVF